MDNLLNHELQNKRIQDAIKKSIEAYFPIETKNRRLEISNVYIKDNLDSNDFPSQKDAKLNRRSWQTPIHADIKLINTETGKIVNQKKNIKIGSLPKLTNRFTTIVDGNEYQTVNQLRRKPGIYSRVKKNGELESEFNLAKGLNFKMMLDPVSEVFYIVMANRKYRLWTLLQTIGVTDVEMEKIWGSKLLLKNKKGALNTEESEMTSIYTKVFRKEPNNYDEVVKGLQEYFTDKGTSIDEGTTKLTLGKSFNAVTGDALLATAKKLLDINKGETQPDDRDSLIYKDLHTIDDLVIDHFKRNTEVIIEKVKRTMGLRDTVREIVPAATFTKPVKDFFTVGDLAATPAQTNPAQIVSDWRKTSPMGTGGIQSRHAITMETRDMQPTHLGFLDPLATPESGRVGVTVGMASEVQKGKDGMATPVIDPKTHKMKFISPLEFYESKIGFPDQYEYKNKKVKPRYAIVNVQLKGKLLRVKNSEVDYYIRSPKSMFSFASNMVPFMQNVQGNRASTAGRMIGQALALDDKEAPLVLTQREATATSNAPTYEQLIGNYLNPILGKDADGKSRKGTVEKITKDYIHIKTSDGKKIKRGLYNNFPLNQDGFLDSTPLVKVGDKVDSKTVLAENNYSVKDKLAIGKNLSVGYMAYKGFNYEDGAVITESAAEKMSHTMLHRMNVFFSPKASVFDVKKFQAWYPNVITNLSILDSKGLVKKGSTVQPGDVVAAFLVEKEMDDSEKALKKLDKFTFSPYMKKVLVWDEEESGVVTEVKQVGRNIDIYVKSTHPFKEGDKLSGRYGNKYIVTKIIPDAEAPHNEEGNPLEIMLNPHGVPSRMNVGQILETAAGKIAEKTGKPYIVNNFEDPDKDMSNEVFKELKKHGLTANEVLTDGKDGDKFEKPIFTGKQYFMKLRHIVKKKEGKHSFGTYDVDEQPTGKGSQRIGVLDTYSYLAHGAKANLRDITSLKSRQNEEYWRNLQLGLPPIKPQRNFIFDKITSYLNAAGVNTDKKGNELRIMPLTDREVKNMSNGELSDPGAMLIGKNLASRKGGLFDPTITGGTKGTQWSHIKLVDRIPNPMYEDAIIKALNLTTESFKQIMKGTKELDGKTGPTAIIAALDDINVNKSIKELKAELKDAPQTNVNKLNRRLRNMVALKELKMNPKEAYTMQFVPVLPPAFRPIYPLPSGDLMVSDMNKHYRDIGLINSSLKNVYKTLEDVDKRDSVNDLYNSVKAMQGFIDPITYGKEKYQGVLKELGRMKTGILFEKGWSKRQDLSARSTITVEPTLGLDEVGVPKEMALEIYKPFVVRHLKESGLKAAEALKNVEDKTDLALNALTSVMEQRPVILNRAPSLHKHSVQAFKPRLADGKSIRLNPLIVKGFNADFDGDTMSLNVPVSKDAVEEAKYMLPSKILFKAGDNSIVPSIAQEYLFGLHAASLIEGDTNKSFSNIKEAKKAKIPFTHTFKMGGKKMTIGQYYINAELPLSLRDYTRELNKKEVNKLLKLLAKDHPSYFTEVINAWKTLGSHYSYMRGNTISIEDFAVDRGFKNKILKKLMPTINKLRGKKKIDALNNLSTKVQKEQDKVIGTKDNNMYKMLAAGSFTKPDSVRQVLSMPGVVADVKGNPIEHPILKSYGEGLDTASYFNSMYGVRKGQVDRSVNTQESGALNKALLNVNRRLVVSEEDCNTLKGLEIEVNNKNVMDRTLLKTVSGVGKRNDIVNSDVLLKAKKKGIKVLEVRSPLTCETDQGVCQHCYGLLPNGALPSVGENVGVLESQAITERSTQLTMQTFHSGGTALGGGGIVAGFGRLEQILKVPEKLGGKATLSSVKGKVKKIDKNLTGGYEVRIEGYGTANDKTFTIPAGRKPIVEIGKAVDKGDAISDGVIKPQELGELKTHLDAQKYMVREASNVYGGDFYDKTFETVIRGISDNATVTEAPEGSNVLRGDKIPASTLRKLNKERRKSKLPKIKFKEYFKSIDTLNTDVKDWFTRITSNRVKAGLITGASQAQYTNLKGKDPIPAYIYGEEFGKSSSPDKGSFY
tara:strand:+ start:18054 stop:24128 length:6075 start_codon:yes stop_codon:yes gene_type:complete